MPYKDAEVNRAYHKAYNARHADRLREQRKAYYVRPHAERYEAWKAWCAANPERRSVIVKRAQSKFQKVHRADVLDKNAARRARLAAVTVEHVDRLLVYERDDGRCGICGDVVSEDSFDLDHIIPLARGGEHSYANVQVSHQTCNRRKRATWKPAA